MVVSIWILSYKTHCDLDAWFISESRARSLNLGGHTLTMEADCWNEVELICQSPGAVF